MENSEIKALIDKYGLYLDFSGERVGSRKAGTKNISREQFVEECSPHKAEIIAYFKEEKKVKEELWARRKATFNAIPGVSEVRQAREERAKWLCELNYMIEEGNGRMPQFKAPTQEELSRLESRYPMACFALQAEDRAYTTVNAELSAIWKDTYNALCDGQAKEKAEMLESSGYTVTIWEHTEQGAAPYGKSISECFGAGR